MQINNMYCLQGTIHYIWLTGVSKGNERGSMPLGLEVWNGRCMVVSCGDQK